MLNRLSSSRRSHWFLPFLDFLRFFEIFRHDFCFRSLVDEAVGRMEKAMKQWLSRSSTAPPNPSRGNRPPDGTETIQEEAASSRTASDGPACATTAGTTVMPPATMDMDDRGSGDTSIGISEEVESGSNSSSSSSAAIFEEHDRRDDVEAPALVLQAAKDARRSIHNDTSSGFGLVIHSFRIRRRDASEQKKRKRWQPQRAEDLHAKWGVECLVCATGNLMALDLSTSTNPPLYTFTRDHLAGKRHLIKGTALIAAITRVPKAAALDGTAAAAAADSRLAIEEQALPLFMNDTSLRRDALPISTQPMAASALEVLVRDNEALLWADGSSASSASSSSSSSSSTDATTATVGHVLCAFCDFTSTAIAQEENALLSELDGHLRSKGHLFLRSHRGGLPMHFSPRPGPAPAPARPPDLSRLCWGFYDPELVVNGERLKTNALFNYDASNVDWFPEPNTVESFTNAVTGEPVQISGTFRSRDPPCARFCTLTTMARLSSLRCPSCATIKSRGSFRKALARRHADSDSSKINFQVNSISTNHCHQCHHQCKFYFNKSLPSSMPSLTRNHCHHHHCHFFPLRSTSTSRNHN